MTTVSGKNTIAVRRSDARKGGDRDAPYDWRMWLKDLERRMDEYIERKEIVVAKKTEELDVDDILDELDDEELESAEDLDADDDPTVKPKAKRGRKGRKTSAKKTSKSKGEGGIGTAELAEAAGVDPRALRVLLRAEFPREEGGRYNWKSLNDPEAKAIIKRVRSGAVKDAQAEKLASLKGRKKTSKSKKTSAKSKKTSSKKGKASAAEAKAERARARRAKAKAEANA